MGNLYSFPDIWESVTVAMNRDCNIYCSFCPVRTDKKSLALRKINEITKYYGSLNPHWTVRIKIQGGEPLLRWSTLANVIKSCHLSNIQFVITTNGLLLSKEKISFLNRYKNRFELVLSIDDQKWDIVKPEKLLKLIVTLRSAGLLQGCAFNITITPNAQNEIVALARQLRERGGIDFRFYPAFYVRWSKAELSRLSSTFDKLADIVKGIPSSRIVYPNKKAHLKVFLSRVSRYNRIPLICDNLLVDNNGDIFASAALLLTYFEQYKKDFLLGNVYQDNWQKNLFYYKQNPNVLTNKLKTLDWIYTQVLSNEIRQVNDKLLKIYGCFTDQLADLYYFRNRSCRAFDNEDR